VKVKVKNPKDSHQQNGSYANIPFKLQDKVTASKCSLEICSPIQNSIVLWFQQASSFRSVRNSLTLPALMSS
jgi:hypothetical protein